MMDNPIFKITSGASYLGLQIYVVEAGTQLTDEITGQVETVCADGALKLRNGLYCTKEVYDKLKEHAKKQGWDV